MSIYPPAEYSRLTVADGRVEEFGALFNELRTRWVKVERLQEYDESPFEGYLAFRRGDHAEAQRLVREMVKSQTEFYSLVRERGISMVRVRICDLPLSPYLAHYEMAAYLADAECGEDIRLVDSADIADLLAQTGVSDYVLFDDRRVVALLYDEDTARLREARLVEDPELVARYVALSDELINRSAPLLDSPIYASLRKRRNAPLSPRTDRPPSAPGRVHVRRTRRSDRFLLHRRSHHPGHGDGRRHLERRTGQGVAHPQPQYPGEGGGTHHRDRRGPRRGRPQPGRGPLGAAGTSPGPAQGSDDRGLPGRRGTP